MKELRSFAKWLRHNIGASVSREFPAQKCPRKRQKRAKRALSKNSYFPTPGLRQRVPLKDRISRHLQILDWDDTFRSFSTFPKKGGFRLLGAYPGNSRRKTEKSKKTLFSLLFCSSCRLNRAAPPLLGGFSLIISGQKWQELP